MTSPLTPDQLLLDNLRRGVKKKFLYKDYDLWQKHLVKNNIKVLYHMTHKDNIPSILEHGILSHNLVYKLCPQRIDNNEVNKRRADIRSPNGRSLHEYAPLYFCQKTAMQRVKTHKREKRSVLNPSDIVFIDISTDVLMLNGSFFTDGNAAVNVSKHYINPADLDRLNWKSMRMEPKKFVYDDEWHRQRMAEVMVYEKVFIEFFERIICFRSEIKSEIIKDVKDKNLSIKVDTTPIQERFNKGEVEIVMDYYFDDDLGKD